MQNSKDAERLELLALRTEATPIGDRIFLVSTAGMVTCFYHDVPIIRYEEKDWNSRRWIMGHLAFLKYATQKQLAEGFPVHRHPVSAALRYYRRNQGVKKEPEVKPKRW